MVLACVVLLPSDCPQQGADPSSEEGAKKPARQAQEQVPQGHGQEEQPGEGGGGGLLLCEGGLCDCEGVTV